MKPLDTELLDELAKDHKLFVTVEENVRNGGFGEHVAETYGSMSSGSKSTSDRYLESFCRAWRNCQSESQIGLSAPDILDAIEEYEEQE